MIYNTYQMPSVRCGIIGMIIKKVFIIYIPGMCLAWVKVMEIYKGKHQVQQWLRCATTHEIMFVHYIQFKYKKSLKITKAVNWMTYTTMANIKKDKKWGTKQYPENLKTEQHGFHKNIKTMGVLRWSGRVRGFCSTSCAIGVSLDKNILWLVMKEERRTELWLRQMEYISDHICITAIP